jgi:hypothetical protein
MAMGRGTGGGVSPIRKSVVPVIETAPELDTTVSATIPAFGRFPSLRLIPSCDDGMTVLFMPDQ